jgi:hypothetical protein
MRLTRVLVTVATALAAAVVTLPALAPPASAHAGEEALLVEPQSTWPGGTVMVRGDLSVTSDVHLLLVDAAGRMTPVGRVDDPPGGHFDVPVTVPPATRLGAWSIVAVAGGDAVGRVALSVGAAPPMVGGRADQAEPLVAPGASPPVVAPAPAAGQAVGRSSRQTADAAARPVARATPSAPAAPERTERPALVWVALALAAAILGLGALRARRDRHAA